MWCGPQLLISLALILLGAAALDAGFTWVSAVDSIGQIYLRSVIFALVTLVASCGLPIAAKWILVGRWRPQKIPLWSFSYVRFWLVKTLVQANPLVAFAGTPLYTFYLRALGAKVGRRTVIFSTTVPVGADLLNIGADTIISRRSTFTCYRAHAGRIELGPVTIGGAAYVGEHTVFDIDTRLGDGAQLGHASALLTGQQVPSGEHWHGSPAQPTEVNYCRVQPARCGPLRRAWAWVSGMLMLVLVSGPAAVGLLDALVTEAADLDDGFRDGFLTLDTWAFYRTALLVSLLIFFGTIIAGLAAVVTVPRLLNRFLVAGRTYPLFGLHHTAHQLIHRITNAAFFIELFGDSSYIIGYLRALGYRLPDVEQTGSNFGAALEQDSPFLTSIGRGTMISDGVSFLNADFSNTSFRVRPVAVGSRSFFGNAIVFPAEGRVGDNCLVGTKAMIPLDGPIRQGVGLLGSPSFEIPRSVERDSRFDHLKTGRLFPHRLAAKNRHNVVTMALFLLVRWVHLLVLTVFALAATAGSERLGVTALGFVSVAAISFSTVYFVVVERSVSLFRRLRPQFCSIYAPYFWWHERYWKLLTPYLAIFNGTPAKTVLWRVLGVQIGARVYDDGCALAERGLVTIGDDCALNAGTIIQCHSMEDGTFKSDHTVIGAGTTLGVGAFVHYGVALADFTVIDADSFVMKGERTVRYSRWSGNPAQELR